MARNDDYGGFEAAALEWAEGNHATIPGAHGKRFVEAIDALQAVIAAAERRAKDRTRDDWGDWDDCAARLRQLVMRKLMSDR